MSRIATHTPLGHPSHLSAARILSHLTSERRPRRPTASPTPSQSRSGARRHRRRPPPAATSSSLGTSTTSPSNGSHRPARPTAPSARRRRAGRRTGLPFRCDLPPRSETSLSHPSRAPTIQTPSGSSTRTSVSGMSSLFSPRTLGSRRNSNGSGAASTLPPTSISRPYQGRAPPQVDFRPAARPRRPRRRSAPKSRSVEEPSAADLPPTLLRPPSHPPFPLSKTDRDAQDPTPLVVEGPTLLSPIFPANSLRPADDPPSLFKPSRSLPSLLLLTTNSHRGTDPSRPALGFSLQLRLFRRRLCLPCRRRLWSERALRRSP